jgi:CRP/FNR family cyclic AMP-dependent transcriptional regulator
MTLYSELRKQFDNLALSKEHENLIESCFLHYTTKKNEILLQKGSVAKYVFFVIKGCLRVFITDEDGNESTRFLILEGNFGTAFPSFILREPSNAIVQSLDTSEILMLSYQDREKLFCEIPGWESAYRKRIERDYIASIQRIESFITLNAAQRYELLLKDNPKLVQRLPAKIIADYLGINRETLSRLKSRK